MTVYKYVLKGEFYTPLHNVIKLIFVAISFSDQSAVVMIAENNHNLK